MSYYFQDKRINLLSISRIVYRVHAL